MGCGFRERLGLAAECCGLGLTSRGKELCHYAIAAAGSLSEPDDH